MMTSNLIREQHLARYDWSNIVTRALYKNLLNKKKLVL